jgi:hypothetical protein
MMPRLFLAAAFALLALPAQAQQEKLAQTGFKFLSLSVDARAAAMGDAVTAMEGTYASLFYNPAAMARQATFFSAGAGQVQHIVDITYNVAGISFAPQGGRYGVLGVTLQHVDYGSMLETIRDNNEQGYIDLGTFQPVAFAVGVGYARALTDRFSVGGHVKYARLDLGSPVDERSGGGGLTRIDAAEGTLAFDFGMRYQTPLRGLDFAVTARNFSQEVTFVDESFQLPLTLRIGFSIDAAAALAPGQDLHALTLNVDATNSRDFSEQLGFGAEYGFADALFLRAGYIAPTDEQGISLGGGVRQEVGGARLGADYAYTEFGIFDQFGRVHRVSLNLAF